MSSTAVAPGTDRARWIALYVLCTGMLMIVLDATVVNVALPSIQDGLGFSTASLAWVVNAYLISFGGLLMLAGRLGDLLGRRNVFLSGMTLFVLASMLCGTAQSQAWLVGARFLQGVGGAFTSAVILGMIVTMFPEPREQARAIGVFAFVASGGGAVGLLAGGVLTQVLNWHWIFFVNLPIGIVTGIAATRLVPRDAGLGLRQGADVPGAVLITGALVVGVYTIVKPAAEEGWTSGTTLGLFALTIALLGLFVAREATARQPLMPLRMFTVRNMVGANLVQVLAVAGMFGVFFLGALYLERVVGDDPLQIGLGFLPVTVVMGALSLRFTDRLASRFGQRPVLVAGLVSIASALALFTRAPAAGEAYWLDVFPVMLLMGFGAGLAFPVLMTLAMSGAQGEDAGLASGLANTTAQVGGALGLAVLATLSASRTGGRTAPAALNDGYHLAFWVACCLVVAAIGVALAVLRPAPALGPETPMAAFEDDAGRVGELAR